MGNDSSQQLHLRSSSIMTQLMLKQQDEVIRNLEQQEIELNRPINQMGDRIAHYAAYKSLYKLLLWLIQRDANFQTVFNHRRLSPIDVAAPQTREWIYNKVNEYKIHKGNMASIKRQNTTKNTPVNSQKVSNERNSDILKKKPTQKVSESNENNSYQRIERQAHEKTQIMDKKQESSKKDSVEFANILFGQKT